MNVKNVSQKDLYGEKLKKLLDEIENLSQDGTKESYEDLQAFVAKLMKVGSVLEVTPDGKKVISVKHGEDVENVDFVEVLNLVKSKIVDNIDNNATTSKVQVTARKNLKDKMAETIDVLLKEDEIISELASRGVTDREFLDNAENEIVRSQEKIDTLNEFLTEQKDMDKLFGRTVKLHTNKYTSKSKTLELQDCKQAEEIMNDIEKKLLEIQKYQSAMESMNPDEKGFKRNEKKIESLYDDIKGLRQNLKDFQINGLDLKKLESLNVKDSKSVGTTITDVQSKKAVIKTNSSNLYDQIRKIMEDNFEKFGIPDPNEVNQQGQRVNPPMTEKEIDEKLSDLAKTIKSYESEIEYEKEYQTQTRNSIDKFNEKLQQKQELEDKFEIKTRQVMEEKRTPVMVEKLVPLQKPKKGRFGRKVKDANGNIEMVDVIDKKTGRPKMVPEKINGVVTMVQDVDANGNPKEKVELVPAFEDDGVTPIMEEYRVLKDSVRKELLEKNGIADEAKYIKDQKDADKAAADVAEKALTRKQKRELIRDDYRKDGKKHPIKFLRSFFRSGHMWNKEYKNKYLSDMTTTGEEVTKTQIDMIVGETFTEDGNKLDVLTAQISDVRNAINSQLVSAISQQKMTDSLMAKTNENTVKASAKSAASAYGLKRMHVAEKLAETYLAAISLQAGKISEEEYNRIKAESDACKKEFEKIDGKQIQDRAYSKDLTNVQTSRPKNAINFKDKEVEEEER